MSLSIGQLNLQLVGDSKGLKKMLPDLNRLGKKINQLGKSQEASAQKAVKALSKQETAIRKQIKAVRDLNAKLREKGADPSKMAANTNSLKAYVRTLSKGTLNSAEFSRANDRLNKTLNKTSKVAKRASNSVNPNKMSKMSNVMRNLESASVLAVGPLSGVGARIRSLGAIASRSALALAIFAGAIVAVIVAAAKLVMGAIRVAKVMEKVHARLKIVGGSSAQAAAHFRFVTKTAKSMGLEIESSAESYSQLAAATKNTSAEGKITRRVFEGLSAAGASMRLSAEQMEGAFRAIQQIASKGRVQAEELIGQLAERIPNAIQIAADAFDTTQAGLLNLVSNGLVPASEFLDKFGRQLVEVYGSSARENINSIEGATNRLSNAQFMFSKKLDESAGLSKTWIKILNSIAEAIEYVTDNFDTAIAMIDDFGSRLDSLGTAYQGILDGANEHGARTREAISDMFTFDDDTRRFVDENYGPIFDAIAELAESITGPDLDTSAWDRYWTQIEMRAEAAREHLEQIQDPTGNTLSDAQLKALADLQIAMASQQDTIAKAAGLYGDLTDEMIKMAKASGAVFIQMQDGIVAIEMLPTVLQNALDSWTALEKKMNAGTRLDEIVAETRTETERLAEGLAEIDRLAGLAQFHFGGPDDREQLRLYIEALDRAKTKLTEVSQVGKALGDSLVNGLEQAIFSGKKFTEVLRQMLIEIMKIILRETVLNGIGKTFGSALTSGLGFATGGRTPANETFMVGEKGPELLSFGKSGNVTPNDAIQRANRHGSGGGNTNVIHLQNNFELAIKDDVRAIIAEAMPQITAAITEALVDETQRSGIVTTLG